MMMLPLLISQPGLVQADPEVVIISLFPILQRGDWMELLQRSQTMLRGEGIPEATRAKLRWMVLRAVAGATFQRSLSLGKAGAVLQPLEGQLVSFPTRSMNGGAGWTLAAENLRATSEESEGGRRQVEIDLALDPKAPLPPAGSDVVASGLFVGHQRPEGMVHNPCLLLRFREGRFIKP